MDSSRKNFAISDPEELELEPKLKASFSYNFFFTSFIIPNFLQLSKKIEKEKLTEKICMETVSRHREMIKTGPGYFEAPEAFPFSLSFRATR